jgi:hypothetical protein
LTFGASLLQTGRGFRDIYTDASRNCPPNLGDFCTPDQTVINPSKPLYALFGQVSLFFKSQGISRGSNKSAARATRSISHGPAR